MRRCAAARALTLTAVILLAATLPALPGCKPRPVQRLTIGEIAETLRWDLSVLPDGTYQLTIANPGRPDISLSNVVVYLLAEVGPSSSVSSAVALPPSLPAGGSATLKINFPTGADWPDEFFVQAVLGPAGPERTETAVAVRTSVRPGNVFLTPVWPENGSVDVRVDDYLILKFDRPVSLNSLRDNLTLSPGVPVEVLPSQDPSDPLAVEVHPTQALAPFTRYTVTVAAGLKSADDAVTMGRDRSLVFSTGPVSAGGLGVSWSPDGTRVAWTAPGAGRTSDLWVGDVAAMTAARKVEGVAGGAPAWSHDGQYVYYGSWTAGGGLGIGRLDLQTGAARALVGSSSLGDPAALRLYASPDGAHLAVEADYGGVDAHSDTMQSVYVYDLTSGALARLPGEGMNSTFVGWPGGVPVYAATFQNFDNSHHFRYNLYGYDPAALAASGVSPATGRKTLLGSGELDNVGGYSVGAMAPVGAYWTWKARSVGRWIIHEPSDVWVLWGLDQTPVPAPTKLTTGGRYRDVSLSPDGTLAAAAKVSGGSWDVVVLDTEDATERTVAGGPAAEFGPVWSPDATRLAYFEVQGTSVKVVVFDFKADSGSAFGTGAGGS